MLSCGLTEHVKKSLDSQLDVTSGLLKHLDVELLVGESHVGHLLELSGVSLSWGSVVGWLIVHTRQQVHQVRIESTSSAKSSETSGTNTSGSSLSSLVGSELLKLLKHSVEIWHSSWLTTLSGSSSRGSSSTSVGIGVSIRIGSLIGCGSAGTSASVATSSWAEST